MGRGRAVLDELKVNMADDAEVGDGCTMEVRQELLNETDGDMCVCGTWHQYGNHNGGWAAAAVDLQDPAHGCQNTAADDSDLCLYCLDEPAQPCDQWGRVVPPQILHVHPQRGNLRGGFVDYLHLLF